ncbi:MAG TPA: hypothetical protein VFW12_05145 [Candidatus Limnocylindria bacterium]|nr:hypothetical protein [Candidatus Limnocylindria bacterium]
MTKPDATTIARVVRAALGDPDATAGPWESTPVQWQSIAPTTAALMRYSGTTPDGRVWSAINKVIRQADARWNSDWRREADVYASGVLERLPPGIRAPRVYAIDESAAEISLWLEEIVESVPVWPLSRYAVAARDLGRFNGAYLAGRPVPEQPPLGADWLAGWVAMTGQRAPEFLDDPSVTDHELVRRAVPREWLDRLRALHAERLRLLAALDRLPRTVSHLDAWRANLLARDSDGATETVAIDWSLLGLAPAGQEIAVFTTGARVWLSLDAADAQALGELSFSSYVDGLRDAGWKGSEADVRFAYAASAALWAGIPAPLWLRWFTLPARREWLERKFGMSLEDAAEPFGEFVGFALDLGDEALAALPA